MDLSETSRATATGEGVSRAPCNGDYQHFAVWRDEKGQWWMAHPTDPRGLAVRYDGEVRDVQEVSS